jgi:hypothetical protein
VRESFEPNSASVSACEMDWRALVEGELIYKSGLQGTLGIWNQKEI